MSAIHHEGPMPRGALLGAAVAIGLAFSAAVAVRTGIVPLAASPVALRAAEHLKPVVTRDLRFTDQADGGVTITDVSAGRVQEIIQPGSHSGFIRGVMRGLARERRMHGVGDGPAFRLQSWPDRGLSLTDMATGRVIELGAFGETNRAAFAELLK